MMCYSTLNVLIAREFYPRTLLRRKTKIALITQLTYRISRRLLFWEVTVQFYRSPGALRDYKPMYLI